MANSPRTLAEARQFSTDELLPGFIDTIFAANQTIQYTDVMITDKPSIRFSREKEGSTAQLYGPGITTLTPSSPSAGPVNFDMKSIANEFIVENIVQGLNSTYTDQVAVDLKASLKAVSYLLGVQMANGTGTGLELAGYDALYSGSTVNASGGFTLDTMYEALDEISGLYSPKTAFVGNKKAISACRREIQEKAGGLTYIELADGRMSVPAVLNLPCLINENIEDGVLWTIDFDSENSGVGLAIQENTQFGFDDYQRLFTVKEGRAVQGRIADFWQSYGSFAHYVEDPGKLVKITNVA